MSIKFNPECPCCGILAIGVGAYCIKWDCVKLDDTEPPIYTTEWSYYFPAQKVTLWRLGYNRDFDFVADQEELLSISISKEVFPIGSPNLNIDYITPKWIKDDGSLDIEGIEEDMNKDNEPGAERKTLGGWPPLFLYIRDGVIANTWYKIVFDLGACGTVEKQFFVSQSNYVGNMYYLIDPSSFPKQLPPGEVGEVSGNQDIKCTCYQSCLLDKDKGIEVSVSYDNAHLNDLESNFYLCGWEYDPTYYPYYVKADCSKSKTLIYNSKVEYTILNSSFTVTCKWNGEMWVSEPIDIYEVKATRKYIDNDTIYHCDENLYTCTCVRKLKVKMVIQILNTNTGGSCTEDGHRTIFTVWGSSPNEEILYEPCDSPAINFYGQAAYFLLQEEIIKTADCRIDLSTLLLPGTISGFGFVAKVVNYKCNPLSGELLIVTPTSTDICAPDFTGSVNGG